MRCDRFREAVSARLDGEPLGLSAAALDDHLARCSDCAGWAEVATRLTRQVRLSSAGVPDLSDTITEQVVLPVRRVLRRRFALRAALALTGAVQLALALAGIDGANLGMHMAEHAGHEAAAWNLALAAAFLATASRPRRAAGLVPLLATFVVALVALSVQDLAGGAVTVSRLATHLAAVAGLLLVMALDRAERALPPTRFVESAGTEERPARRRLRGVA